MFAFPRRQKDSERHAYNTVSFCGHYSMDKKPLNTNEQKDMSEFFTDLVSNLEECVPCEHPLTAAQAQAQVVPGHPDFLRHTMRYLFNGVITNLVLSLECPHVSRSFEECYTIRCQAIGVRTLDVRLFYCYATIAHSHNQTDTYSLHYLIILSRMSVSIRSKHSLTECTSSSILYSYILIAIGIAQVVHSEGHARR